MLNPFVKRLFEAAGLRVRRAGPDNRFDAMADALGHLRERGFEPSVVIDGGANVGQWARLASAIFPRAQFHLIEPQPACWPLLEARFPDPRFVLHKVALTAPGVPQVRLIATAPDGRGAGSFVPGPHDDPAAPSITCPAAALDELILPRVAPGDHILLKLDLEGHELPALEGASKLLRGVDVIVSEVTFFDVYGMGHTTFAELLRYLQAHDFELYDLAALAARRRDGRLRMGDAVFARRDTALASDLSWD